MGFFLQVIKMKKTVKFITFALSVCRRSNSSEANLKSMKLNIGPGDIVINDYAIR